ncbi:hypothetical protein [Deinococcus radiophilus]|uniref:hypothetical protein n=1 Tax=Deinococcus radiophilus TaxID=32062 RepID=UPI0036087CAB
METARADLLADLTATELVDTAARGRVQVRGRQLWADLTGQAQGTPLRCAATSTPAPTPPCRPRDSPPA